MKWLNRLRVSFTWFLLWSLHWRTHGSSWIDSNGDHEKLGKPLHTLSYFNCWDGLMFSSTLIGYSKSIKKIHTPILAGFVPFHVFYRSNGNNFFYIFLEVSILFLFFTVKFYDLLQLLFTFSLSKCILLPFGFLNSHKRFIVSISKHWCGQ